MLTIFKTFTDNQFMLSVDFKFFLQKNLYERTQNRHLQTGPMEFLSSCRPLVFLNHSNELIIAEILNHCTGTPNHFTGTLNYGNRTLNYCTGTPNHCTGTPNYGNGTLNYCTESAYCVTILCL